jgi:hypothetical protein
MLSERKVAANRENAALSTGPVTKAGIRISSMNRTTHGLTARQVVLKEENQQEFDDLHADLMKEYQPHTPTQEELVQEAAASAWRLRRADRMETKSFDEGGDGQDLDKLRRYRTSIERSFHKAIDQLRKFKGDEAKDQDKKESRDASDEKIRKTAFTEALTALMGAPLPGGRGFVSQNDEEDQNEDEIEQAPDDEALLQQAS